MNTSSRKVIITLGVSILIAVFANNFALELNAYKNIFLGGIFFFSGLLIDIPTILSDLRRWKILFYTNLWNLILTPLIFGGAIYLFDRELAGAVALLTAVPVGMTVPLFAGLAGGSVSFASLYLVTSTIFFPLTFIVIGYIFSIFTSFGELVAITLNLILVILVPMFFASAIAKTLKGQSFLKPLSSYGSLICLGAILSAVYAGVINNYGLQFDSTILRLLIICVIIFLGFHIIGYWSVLHQSREIRISSMLGLTYTNFSLAIVIGEQVWGTGDQVTFLALSSFIWMVSYIILQNVLTNQKKSG